MSYAQAGAAGLGATLGGIGDIVSAASYHRPTLHPASGMEQRLRTLAQSQLLGGGQELLGGTALYNQMAPILMSQLPGMSYVPGVGGGPTSVGGTPGATSLGGVSGAATANSPLQSYGQAVSNRNNLQALQSRMTALQAQIKGTKPGAGQLQALKQQQKQLQRQISKQPTAAQLERQTYNAGTNPDLSMYNLSMNSPQGTSSAGAGDQGMTLQGLRDALSTGTPHPDFLANYYGAGGNGMPSPGGY